MNQNFRRLAAGLFLVVLMLQFNNCGNYAEPATNGLETSASLACTDTSCVTASADNLTTTVHLTNGEYDVTAGLSEFNIGGDCNEGGYAVNVIHWELTLNGVSVRNSSMPVGGVSMDTRCVNGRFSIYVELYSIAGDNVDRTGLQTNGTGSARSPYNLVITITGQDMVGGQPNPSTQGQSIVPLSAI